MPPLAPPNGVVLMAGTTDGALIFTSDKNRRVWQRHGPYLSGWQIDSLLGLTLLGGGVRIVAGVSHRDRAATLFFSDTLGAEWSAVASPPRYGGALAADGATVRRVWQLALGSDGHILYAGVEDAGLFTSQDGGQTWQGVDALNHHPSRAGWQRTRGGLALHSIVVDRLRPERMWVAISGAGLFRTVNGGAGWAPCNQGLPTEGATATLSHKLVGDPHTPDTLYLQHFHGPYRSEDGGGTWRPVGQGLPSRFGFPMVAAADGALYVVPLESAHVRRVVDGRLRVYRSGDRGDTWAPRSQGLPEGQHDTCVLRDALVTDTLEPAGVYVGTSTGELFGSPDGGASWAPLSGGHPRVTCLCAVLRFDR